MANLIDRTYFVGEINLPPNVLQGVPASIDSYITRYEREVLEMLLGYDLYKLLKAEIDAAVYTTIWDNLVNGAEYVSGSNTYKWRGLINDDKQSMIAYYVYYQFVKDNINTLESIGTVTGMSENSSRVPADGLLIKAWNNFVDQYILATEFMLINHSDYPLWRISDVQHMNIFGI